MWFFYVVLVTTAMHEVFLCTLHDQKLNILVKKIITDLNPYQLVIFISNSEVFDTLYCDCTLSKLVQEIPAMTIDNEKFLKTKINESSILSRFENLGDQTLYVFIQYRKDNNDTPLMSKLNKQLEFIIHISPAYTRPKCLVIFFSKMIFTEESLKRILMQAWLKNFLDFTIIEINTQDNNVYVNYFNPFYDVLTKELLRNNLCVFPNKLNDVNKYPIKLPVYEYAPYIRVTKNRFGDITNVDGIKFSLLSIAMQKMNFRLQYVKLNSTGREFDVILNDSLTKLEKGDINVVITPLPSELAKGFCEIDLGYNCDSIIAIVPIIQFTKLNIPESVYFYVFIVPVFTVLIIYGVNLFKIQKEDWKIINVLEVLFGIPTVKQPRKLKGRIILLSIIFLSVIYSTDFYSKIINVHLIRNEMSFDSIQEIDESGFDIYIRNTFPRDYDFNGSSESRYMSNILKNIKPVRNIATCIEKLRNDRNCICITMRVYANTFINTLLDADGDPIMKIAKPVFSCGKLVYAAEKGFPHASRLYDIFLRIYASGILNSVINKQFLTNTSTIQDTLKTKTSDFDKELFVILVGGYIISIIVFSIEIYLTSKMYKNILKKRRMNKCCNGMLDHRYTGKTMIIQEV